MAAVLPNKKAVQALVDAWIAAGRPGFTAFAREMERPDATVRRWITEYAPAMGITTAPSPEEEHPTIQASTPDVAQDAEDDRGLQEKARAILLRRQMTLEALAAHCKISRGRALDLCDALKLNGVNLQTFGDQIGVLPTPAPSVVTPAHTYLSRPGGYYKFGYLSDNHYGSKYAREDVVTDLYDWFAAEGVDVVFNTGNYIDGEARFNKHDIHVHGMQNQIDYFVAHYPQRPGIVTKFVSGDDHEGWYGQREGVDIGWLTEQTAKRAGRSDLIHMGFVESFIKLQHADVPEAASQLLLVHPGGGSAYATSYAPQKYIEALQGGEKPAIILFGHWHKIFDLLIRNVICLGGGCTKDLDPFGRKNKLQYHLGGMIVELWQDAKGSITRYRVEKKQYFDRGYYNDQWSYVGQPVRRPNF